MSQNWEDLYQKGDTEWDKGEPSPGLVDFLNEHPALPKGTVLVPGCGMGHDARAWASKGFRATGLDIAPSAVQRSIERTDAAGLSAMATFRLGNFLRDEPFATFDYIFEHTLFCAIQPGERDFYVEAVRRWLKPEGSYVAVFYMIPDTDGPPFGTTREEIRRRFSPYFELKEKWVPRSYPNRTDLEWMTIWSPWKNKPGS
jgi:SAM-dependent methyltransferase